MVWCGGESADGVVWWWCGVVWCGVVVVEMQSGGASQSALTLSNVAGIFYILIDPPPAGSTVPGAESAVYILIDPPPAGSTVPGAESAIYILIDPPPAGSTVPGAESAIYILIGGLGLSMVVSLLEFVYKYKRQVVRKKVRPTSSVTFCQFSWDPGPHVLLELPDPVCRLPHGQLQLPRGILFCSLAVLDPTVGHTMDVLSPHISVLCHCD